MLADISSTFYQKRSDTLVPFAKTSPERLRLTDKAKSHTGKLFLIHTMESGAENIVRFALVKSGVVGSPSDIRKGCDTSAPFSDTFPARLRPISKGNSSTWRAVSDT